jgi:rhodanese-related sulfurtransferase
MFSSLKSFFAGLLSARSARSKMYQEILPEEVSLWQQRGARIVDVREPWEYERSHLPGAVNIPSGNLPARIGEIKQPVVLVCASGNRSGKAARYLTEHGFTDVANLLGGTAGWRQRGLPVE